jgi:hypothetical protein
MGGIMATVGVVGVYSYGTPFETAVLQPGATRGISWGPSDAFRNAAVVLTPHPIRVGLLGQATLRISDLESWSIKGALGPPSSGLSFTEWYVGAYVTNIGSTPIEAFTVTVAVITPGPDGH